MHHPVTLLSDCHRNAVHPQQAYWWNFIQQGKAWSHLWNRIGEKKKERKSRTHSLKTKSLYVFFPSFVLPLGGGREARLWKTSCISAISWKKLYWRWWHCWWNLGQDQVRLTESLHSSSPQIGVQLIVFGWIILIKMWPLMPIGGFNFDS